MDTSNLQELLSKKLIELQKCLDEKDKVEIEKCNNEIYELQKLISLRNLKTVH